tara:strand:+ start:311 stop:475 length:165 start_codon:yes stop_codon:yes gene_type:complete
VITFKLNDPMLNQFESYCQETGQNYSETIRLALTLLINKHIRRHTSITGLEGLS